MKEIKNSDFDGRAQTVMREANKQTMSIITTEALSVVKALSSQARALKCRSQNHVNKC